MTGNKNAWRAPLAGLASVAMIATMGVATSTANAESVDGNNSRASYANPGNYFELKVYDSAEPTKVLDTVSVTAYGDVFGTPSVDPDGDGRVLTGYSYDRAGKEKVTFPLAAKGDVKVFAQYADAYKVGFDYNDDGVADKTIDVAEGASVTESDYAGKVTEPGAPSGKVFAGWAKTNKPTADDLYLGEAITADTTLYARFDGGQNVSKVGFHKAGTAQSTFLYTLANRPFPQYRAPQSMKQDNFKEWQLGGKKYDFTQNVANSNDDVWENDIVIDAVAYAGDESVNVYYKFNTNGVTTKRTAADYTDSKDALVKKPADPVKKGAYFTGWYTDKDLKTPFDFDTPVKDQPGYVTGDPAVTLYAGWDTKNIAAVVYNLNYADEDPEWQNNDAYQVHYVDARGGSEALSGLEDYTVDATGTVNASVLNGWFEKRGGDPLSKVPAVEKDKGTLELNANWTRAVSVRFDGDGGFFSNNSNYKYVTVPEGSSLANAEKPLKADFTFQYWVNEATNTRVNLAMLTATDGLSLRAVYEATPILDVAALHKTPAVSYPNKSDAYQKNPGYTESSWKTYVDTWYDLQDEWFAYFTATSHQDMINKGNSLAAKYVAAQDKLVKSTSPSPSPFQSPFADVTSDTPHADEIVWLYDNKLTTGYVEANGTLTFRPTANLNRQDYAAFLYRLAGSPEFDAAKATNPFADVNENTPHYKEILWAASNGVIKGYEKDGKTFFEGMAFIQRQDAVEMLYRLAGEPDAPEASFTDSAMTPFAKALAWAKAEKVSVGYPDGSFGVGKLIIRQDAAAFLKNASAVINK